MTLIKKFLDYLNKTGSPYHSCFEAEKLLLHAGFNKLNELDDWELEKGGRYFIVREDSEIFAFICGTKLSENSGFLLVGTHTDSPCLRLRPNSKIESQNWLQVGCQTYGGGLWHTWLDRPLGFAGRLIVRENSKLKTKLIFRKDPLLVIPNLAIHLQTADERKAFTVNPETHLQPILCKKPESNEGILHEKLLKNICGEENLDPNDVVEVDLCLMDSQESLTFGLNNEFISSPRLDNLCSTYFAIQSLIDSSVDSPDVLGVFCFDHEECGSQSNVGANSGHVRDILQKLGKTLKLRDSFAKSFFVSADMAHAIHPNYPEKHQKEHKVQLNEGLVLKFNSNQRYSTTSRTSAVVRELCRDIIPVQNFVVRNDSPCGSTIGPYISSELGIPTCDLGIPQFAMHSCRETCGTKDCEYLYRFFLKFFSSTRHFL